MDLYDLEPGDLVRTEFQQVAGIKATRIRGRPLLRYMAGESAVGVVETALAALDAGKDVVTPGMMNQAITCTAQVLPRSRAAFEGQARHSNHF